MPQLEAAIDGISAGSPCATGARRWGSRPLSAPAAGCFRKPSRPRRCCARGCGGSMSQACNLSCAIAGPAGMKTAVCCFEPPDGQSRRRGRCDRAGARRRKLAAARLRRRLGRRRSLRKAWRSRRSGRPIAASPSPGPTSSATASRASRSRASRCRSASHTVRGEAIITRDGHRGRRGLCAVGRLARGHRAVGAGDPAHRPAARSRNATI